MSGIFGFTLNRGDPALCSEALMGLEYWNRIYGEHEHGCTGMGRSGLGCHVEHFSEDFPGGAPVLEMDGMAAVVDALLFNREELEATLDLSPKCGLSDEELLLKLIREKGFKALQLVNGDFAGAVFDRESGSWTLFRDHLGVRPLYYYLDDEAFVFSTDIRGIAAVPGIALRPNEKRLFASVHFCNTLSLQETDYANVRCILPGAVTVVKAAGEGFSLREEPYWQLRRRRIRLADGEAYAARMRELVADAVRRRLEAVPGLVGAELSGGLDSSVIDILINRSGRQGCYYSWSADPKVIPLSPDGDERDVIRDICRQEGIECRYLYAADGQACFGMYDRVVPSFINTTELTSGSRWMRDQGARVIFTGHGGDEGVSHRGSRFELLCNGELLACLRLHYAELAGRSLRPVKTIYNAFREAVSRAASLHEPLHETDMHSVILCESLKERMLKEFRNEPLYFSVFPHRFVMQGGTRNRLDNVAYQGASAGVRYLIPFVDHRVMDFAVSIPRSLYLNEKGNRMIYREAFRDLMPESLAKVDYKEFLSLKGHKRTSKPKEQQKLERDFFLARLDPEYWKGILDMEAIAALAEPEDPESEAARTYRFEIHELYRCILIQNTALRAKEWRDIDERPDLL